jgi:hypothetical protein
MFHASSSNSENMARVMRQPRGVARFGASTRGRAIVFGLVAALRNGGGQCASLLPSDRVSTGTKSPLPSALGLRVSATDFTSWHSVPENDCRLVKDRRIRGQRMKVRSTAR